MEEIENPLACAIADLEAANNVLQAIPVNESTLHAAHAALETLAVASAVLVVMLKAQYLDGDWLKAMGISPQKGQEP